MVKFIGAVMTGLSCAYFGFRISISMKKRVKSLSDIEASLEMLESEVGFGAEKLEKAFCRVDRNGLFTSAAASISESGIYKAWREAVKNSQRELCLTEADCDALYMFGKNIGKTDSENQIKHIKYIKELLRAQKESAREEYNRLGRIYRGGGILTGLMIIIILA